MCRFVGDAGPLQLPHVSKKGVESDNRNSTWRSGLNKVSQLLFSCESNQFLGRIIAQIHLNGRGSRRDKLYGELLGSTGKKGADERGVHHQNEDMALRCGASVLRCESGSGACDTGAGRTVQAADSSAVLRAAGRRGEDGSIAVAARENQSGPAARRRRRSLAASSRVRVWRRPC
eukprot:1876020-Pleurochrysis_carterae.AAC.1